ncbi:MAG: hypothetical protein ACREMY_05510, partial [bacterium]
VCTSGVMLVSAGARAHAPVASLNHFWAALDDETARAIITSDYLTTFANVVVPALRFEHAPIRRWPGTPAPAVSTMLQISCVVHRRTAQGHRL